MTDQRSCGNCAEWDGLEPTAITHVRVCGDRKVQSLSFSCEKWEAKRSDCDTSEHRLEILNSAIEAVSQRGQQYGSPVDVFGKIADLWNAAFKPANPFTPSDIALAMGLMKIARLQANQDHKDSWVDLAGYAACGAECARRKSNDAET